MSLQRADGRQLDRRLCRGGGITLVAWPHRRLSAAHHGASSAGSSRSAGRLRRRGGAGADHPQLRWPAAGRYIRHFTLAGIIVGLVLSGFITMRPSPALPFSASKVCSSWCSPWRRPIRRCAGNAHGALQIIALRKRGAGYNCCSFTFSKPEGDFVRVKSALILSLLPFAAAGDVGLTREAPHAGGHRRRRLPRQTQRPAPRQ